MKKTLLLKEHREHSKNGVIPKGINFTRNRKNFLSIGMLLFVFLGFGNRAMGQTYNIGYPIATDLTATLSGSGTNLTLTISGIGAMKDFTSTLTVPWYSTRTNIKNSRNK